MPSIDISYEFDAPAADVWAFLQDFGNIRAWWPAGGPVDIERVEIVGNGIGMVRNIYNKGIPGCTSERLDFIDADSKTLKLSIINDMPSGLITYQATGVVEDCADIRCRLVYHGDYEVEQGREQEAQQFLHTVYQLMFSGLEQALAR